MSSSFVNILMLFVSLVQCSLGWTVNNCSGRGRINPFNLQSNHQCPTTSILSMGKKSPNNSRKRKHDPFLDFIEQPMNGGLVDPSAIPPGPPHTDDLAPLIRTIAAAADKRKAEDIVALRVSKLTAVTSFIVIVSGNSRPQNQAIAASIQDDVTDMDEDGGGRTLKGNGVPEGTADSGWILLDYGDVMVHVMTPKSRLFYDIEGQWREKGGEEMMLSDVLVPNNSLLMKKEEGGGQQAMGGGGRMEGLKEEDDPFWS